MPIRRSLAAAAITLLALAATACATLPERPQGSFPPEWPRIPAPAAEAAQVPPGYRVELVAADLTYPTSITFDDGGAIYVAEAGYAYGDPIAPAQIVRLGTDGSRQVVASQLQGPITDILWHGGALYVSHKGKISRVESDGKIRDLVTGLPSYGDHHNNQMSVGPDGWIYFGQGTVTNSGIVGLDNAIPYLWLTQWPDAHDIPAKDVVLTGETVLAPNVNNVAAKQGQLVSLGPIFGQFVTSIFVPEHPGSLLARTGAYQPFGVSGARTIPGQVKSSGTILRMSPDGKQLQVYAWGLRNPFGVRWAADKKLYVSDNGYDDRGARPIANAPDVIWKIREDGWYGWPDYAAGIPVSDPSFRSERGPAPSPLLAEHPPVEKPFLTRPKHAGVTKFDFSRSDAFGFTGQMFLGEVGGAQPITGGDPDQHAHRRAGALLPRERECAWARWTVPACCYTGPEAPGGRALLAGWKGPVRGRCRGHYRHSGRRGADGASLPEDRCRVADRARVMS